MRGRVPPEPWDRLLLPLGELTKPAVRARARRAGLPPADQAESQDVCFAPGDHREFLTARGAPRQAGEIVDGDGRVLGTHDGWWRFTVGQRRARAPRGGGVGGGGRGAAPGARGGGGAPRRGGGGGGPAGGGGSRCMC